MAMSDTAGAVFRARSRLKDYASANEAPLGCSCGNCAQCEASYLTTKEASEIEELLVRLQSDLTYWHDALWEIGSYKLSQFAGPHDMALACVHKASETLTGFHGSE